MAHIETRRNAAGKVTSYRAHWRIKVDGAWKQKTQTFPGDRLGKIDARRFIATLELDGHRAALDDLEPEVDDGAVTVKALIERYIEDRAKRVRSDRTTHDYSRDAERWIYPPLGDRLAGDLREHDVQQWVDSIDRAPKTIANVHGVLSGAYKWGTRQRTDNGQPLVTGNPCDGTVLPKRRKVAKGLRPGEWAILYQAAVEVSPDAADLLLFLVGTGWRWGEATALQVHEYDPAKRAVEVGRVWRRNAANELHLVEDAKSDAGYLRRVKVSPRVADMLNRRVAGRELGEFVFVNPQGSMWRHSNFYNRYWRKPPEDAPSERKYILDLAKSRGLRSNVTPHALRHAHGTMMIESGQNVAAVQRRMGHESVKTTIDVYARMIEDVSEAGLTALDDALFGKAPRLRAVDDA